MTTCHIDHITIVAPSLARGADLVYALLGVRPQQGGEHPRMGTHNLLLALGEAVFLEVIAINPNAPAPKHPRWFGLDQLPSDSAPFLSCWVARTDDIHSSVTAAPEQLGVPQPMSRGALEWLITIPNDGSLALGGAAPALIQWQTAIHPAQGMQDKGCRLVKLEVLHPEPQRVRALIDSLQFSESDAALAVVAASAPGLVAHIDTPLGLRTIGTTRPARRSGVLPAS